MNSRDAFRDQAKSCEALGSPFMARLMSLTAERLNRDTAVGARILDWPGDAHSRADSVPLRFAGALHALAREGAGLARVYPPAQPDPDQLWEAVEAAMDGHSEHMLDWLTRAPQTNEVRRSAAILPVLHLLAARYRRPIALIELGCAAGLNLRADRFSLKLAGLTLGPPSTVQLTPDWRGPLPVPGPVEIAGRTGIDLHPIHPTTPEGAHRLLSYLWADQPDRIARTEAAIDISREFPAKIVPADAADGLKEALTDQVSGAVTLIYHTVAWQYFPAETARAAQAMIESAGHAATEDTPVAWFGMEADDRPAAGLTLRSWPGGQVERLGRADFHGRWIEWTGPGDERLTASEGS